MTPGEQVLSEAQMLLLKWDGLSPWLVFGGYTLIGLGTISSLAMSIFTENLKTIYIKTLGFIAAICTGLLAAFHPIDVGLSFRQAWRIVHQATIEYRGSNDPEHLIKLVDAIAKAEGIIETAQGRVPTELAPAKSPDPTSEAKN